MNAKFDFVAPNPKPETPVVVVARSAKDAKFFEAERSTPFEASVTGLTSSVFAPKLKPENGEGFAGSVAAGSGFAAVRVPNFAKVNPEAETGFSEAEVSIGFPKLKPEVGVATAGAAGFVSAGLPKLNPEATGVAVVVVAAAGGVAAAPKANPDGAGVEVDVEDEGLTPNLNPEAGGVEEAAEGPRLKPPPPTAGPLPNLNEDEAAEVEELLNSSSLPGWIV